MEKYEPIALIGKGNFGSISKIRRISDGKILVWKELDYGKMDEKEKHHIVSEVNILRELHHPNIVRYYDRIIDKKHSKIFIIMEYCQGGDLSQLIKRCKHQREYINEEIIWKIFTQVLQALYACHTHKGGKILHRDIKPSNVFLDNNNNVKLGDFGLSRMLSNESTFAYSNVGTPYYMSPEQIDENRYNEKSDIWSLGCFLYELASLRPPFEATNHLSLALKIKAGKVERIPEKYSDELSRVIRWMMTVNQANRPMIEDLLNLPQISIRIRERKLKDNYNKLKALEENLKQREIRVQEKEAELKLKEQYLDEREKCLIEKEERFAQEMINTPKRMPNTSRQNYTTNITMSNLSGIHSNSMHINSINNLSMNSLTNQGIQISNSNKNLNSVEYQNPVNYISNNYNSSEIDGNEADSSGMFGLPPKPRKPVQSLKDIYHKPNVSSSLNSYTAVNTLYSTHQNQTIPFTSQSTTIETSANNNNNLLYSNYFSNNNGGSNNSSNNNSDYGKYQSYNNQNIQRKSFEMPQRNKMTIDYNHSNTANNMNLKIKNNAINMNVYKQITPRKYSTPKRNSSMTAANTNTGTPSVNMNLYSPMRRDEPNMINPTQSNYVIPRNNSCNFNMVNTNYKKRTHRGVSASRRNMNMNMNFDGLL